MIEAKHHGEKLTMKSNFYKTQLKCDKVININYNCNSLIYEHINYLFTNR